jgi:hypothetical protein
MATRSESTDFLPPHQPTQVGGFHAYSHRVSVAPGEIVDVRVSNDGPVNAKVVRLGEGRVQRSATQLAAAHTVADLGEVAAQERSICRGSYVYVPDPVQLPSSFAVELWFRVLAGDAVAGLLDYGPLRLGLDEENRLSCAAHIGAKWQSVSTEGVDIQLWHHVVAQCRDETMELYLDGNRVGEPSIGPALTDRPTAMLLGAHTDAQGRASNFFAGDLCSPSLYDHALDPDIIITRFRDRSQEPAAGCIGHWKFDALEGAPYRDVSPSARHGRGINYPLRLIPGPRRVGESDWIACDPTTDADFGHAVRLMADQIVDCRWSESLSWCVPEDLPTGQYAVRLRNAAGEERDVPFIVRPSRPRSRLMCLSTTNTRIAYNYQPFDNPELDYGAYQDHPAYPMLGHLLGQRRPARGQPYFYTVVNLELPLYAWLSEQGFAYDVYSEWDLEADPSLLDHYDVVAWAGHCEYWTASRFEQLQRFRQRGGHILSLSGNTCFWRVSIDVSEDLIEVRKHGDESIAGHGVTCDVMMDNAHWHQLDHLPGRTMQHSGWPQYQLGLGMTNGWTTPCAIDGPKYPYDVLAADHSLFHQPHAIDTDGPFAIGGAGYETDISCRSSIERFGPPRHPAFEPRDDSNDLSLQFCMEDGPVVLARAHLPDAEIFDFDLHHDRGELWSEMMWWERPGVGYTFAAGSCMAALALQEDENFARFMLNVLHRMGLESS